MMGINSPTSLTIQNIMTSCQLTTFSFLTDLNKFQTSKERLMLKQLKIYSKIKRNLLQDFAATFKSNLV